MNTGFAPADGGQLAIYFPAGYPQLSSTSSLLLAAQEAGATLVEVGIPYSDPLADGPVIEKAAAQALENGMNLHLLLDQLKQSKAQVSIPVYLMGYANAILQYGWEAFCQDAVAAGVSGLILPDLPLEEWEGTVQQLMEKYGLKISFLITPDTPAERREKLVAASSGFVYAVSSSSITGTDKNFGHLTNYFELLQGIAKQKPVMVGFGIKSAAQLQQVQQYVTGGIVGTAFVEAVGQADNPVQAAKDFVTQLLRP